MKLFITRWILWLSVLCFMAEGDCQLVKSGWLKMRHLSDSGPTSNAINDILVVGNAVWVAAGSGLSRTADLGLSWTQVTPSNGLGRGGVSALAERNGVIWVATAFDTTVVEGAALPAGGGLSYSADGGNTWRWIPQPVDSRDETEYAPTTTNIQNVTYDIALTDSAVWIASWGGGLRRSTDMGETWEVVTVDGLPFDVSNNNFIHMAFSIRYDGENLWAGSAAGIHKSTDGGETWTTFSHQNQPEGISGNHVVAIGNQENGGREVVWAATGKTMDETEIHGVSKSEDGGLTWTVPIEEIRAWNFAFDDSVVYVATDEGLFKSLDWGDTWAVFPQIVDAETGETVLSEAVYSVAIGPGRSLWVGSSDGLALTLDDGATWKIFRAFQVPGQDGAPQTYAYPNPFSPLRHNVYGWDGHVRFQYRASRPTRVTVKIYDFGMNLVKTVVEEKIRPAGGDFTEVWDGRNDLGEMVANGVYFYKITLSDQQPLWGKVMVVN